MTWPALVNKANVGKLEEYELVLNPILTPVISCTYYKNPFEEVVVSFWVSTGSTTVSYVGLVVSTLPLGFRSSAQKSFSLTLSGAGAANQTPQGAIYPDGRIVTSATSTSGLTYAQGQTTLFAG